ncbi:MAG: hypothetical protein QOH18_607, partial [Solirubrobacterales bacterium]|nr:hypothetical protein [Solirubrobacterales bacterium]
MTLNITVIGEEAIYQSADFRLVNPKTGELITESSSKLVVVGGWEWNGLVSYTGIGRWPDKDTSDWLVDWLTGEKLGPEELVERIREKGSAWLTHIRRATGTPWRHTFVAAAFPDAIPTVWVISNFEDAVGLTLSTPRPALMVSRRAFKGRSLVVVTGQKASVDRATKRRLQRAADGRPDPARIRRLLTEANEAAARSPAGEQSVSVGCSVSSFRSEGLGTTQVSPGFGVDVRRVMSGIPFPTSAELKALLGDQLDGYELLGVHSAAPAPPRTESLARCRPIHRGEESAAYSLHEVSHPDLGSSGAVDISDSGLILGNGYHVDADGHQTPWLSRWGGEPELCGFIGEAVAVNDGGVVAATVHEGGTPARALRWKGEAAEELDDYKGGPTAARDISADATVVGHVCTEPENLGQNSNRPAAWLPDGSLRVLEDFEYEWGEASAIAGSSVLIWGQRGNETHALLWSLDDGGVMEVGKLGIGPVDITDSGVLLGIGGDPQSGSVPVLRRPGAPWREFGGPAGA